MERKSARVLRSRRHGARERAPPAGLELCERAGVQAPGGDPHVRFRSARAVLEAEAQHAVERAVELAGELERRGVHEHAPAEALAVRAAEVITVARAERLDARVGEE